MMVPLLCAPLFFFPNPEISFPVRELLEIARGLEDPRDARIGLAWSASVRAEPVTQDSAIQGSMDLTLQAIRRADTETLSGWLIEIAEVRRDLFEKRDPALRHWDWLLGQKIPEIVGEEVLMQVLQKMKGHEEAVRELVWHYVALGSRVYDYLKHGLIQSSIERVRDEGIIPELDAELSYMSTSLNEKFFYLSSAGRTTSDVSYLAHMYQRMKALEALPEYQLIHLPAWSERFLEAMTLTHLSFPDSL